MKAEMTTMIHIQQDLISPNVRQTVWRNGKLSNIWETLWLE
eukprot:CAMPEP_0117040190 /NCGR_PEP_ID=MMETSP0472-20121206/28145_1 /TAXON_ID=693140 ORGANISM="Tiarina fusus, Strain LIS" /NCGR_SAMPLE_ID=MMETSP0472 /ASSEMBLY_ACC=CAM_ASM_000603 /LENGTH=40 /DNA_ID= /DNA_START= /DNA_END= /DNA_ORIENTATION=